MLVVGHRILRNLLIGVTLGVEKRDTCFADLPLLVGIFLCRVSHDMSVCNKAMALKRHLLLLCSLYDEDLVQRPEHETVFSVV